MGREACLPKPKLRRGLWSPEEDEKLYNHIIRYGVGCWSSVPKLAGLERCGKSCRLRWINYLRPDLKRGSFSQQEEELIISLHKILGNRWSQIASQLPGRTDNEIKNFWNSSLKKKLRQRGIDPSTHKPLHEKAEAQEEKLLASRSTLAHSPTFDPLPETQGDGINPMQAGMNHHPYSHSYHSLRSEICDYSSGIDVSDATYGYGDSSSNSSNWNCNVGSNVVGYESLSWSYEGKVETVTHIDVFGEEPSPMFDPKFGPNWQQQQQHALRLEDCSINFPIRSLSRDLSESSFDIARGALEDEFSVDFL